MVNDHQTLLGQDHSFNACYSVVLHLEIEKVISASFDICGVNMAMCSTRLGKNDAMYLASLAILPLL